MIGEVVPGVQGIRPVEQVSISRILHMGGGFSWGHHVSSLYLHYQQPKVGEQQQCVHGDSIYLYWNEISQRKEEVSSLGFRRHTDNLTMVEVNPRIYPFHPGSSWGLWGEPDKSFPLSIQSLSYPICDHYIITRFNLRWVVRGESSMYAAWTLECKCVNALVGDKI